MAVYLVYIPGIRYYYFNNTINIVMFNCFCYKPQSAKGEMQTDNDTARPEESRRNQNASVDKNKEADKEEEEDEQEEQHDKEWEKV